MLYDEKQIKQLYSNYLTTPFKDLIEKENQKRKRKSDF